MTNGVYKTRRAEIKIVQGEKCVAAAAAAGPYLLGVYFELRTFKTALSAHKFSAFARIVRQHK